MCMDWFFVAEFPLSRPACHIIAYSKWKSTEIYPSTVLQTFYPWHWLSKSSGDSLCSSFLCLFRIFRSLRSFGVLHPIEIHFNMLQITLNNKDFSGETHLMGHSMFMVLKTSTPLTLEGRNHFISTWEIFLKFSWL